MGWLRGSEHIRKNVKRSGCRVRLIEVHISYFKHSRIYKKKTCLIETKLVISGIYKFSKKVKWFEKWSDQIILKNE